MRRIAHVSFLVPALIAFSALLVSPAPSAVSRWQPVGPFGHEGNELFSSGDPAILYANTFYLGLYRSEDGGQSWHFAAPRHLKKLSIDPRDPDAFFAAPPYEEVVRSRDGGRTFEPAADGLTYQGRSPEVHSFVRDPTNPDVVFAGTDSGLFRNDGGGKWKLIAFGGLAVTAFAIDPLSPAVWHAGTTESPLEGPCAAWISTDAGSTWSRAPGELDERYEVTSLLFDPVRPHRVYAVASCRTAVFTSGSWRLLPVTRSRYSCAMTITEGGRLVALFQDDIGRGLAVSDDGGETWTAHGGPRDDFMRVVVAAGGGEVLVASGRRGLWRSADGGSTWRASTRGISGFLVVDVAVAGDGAVFASLQEEGIFRSRDAGRSWKRLVRGLHADAAGSLGLAVDPRDAAVVWAGGAELHRSGDAGLSWQGLSLPRRDRWIAQILIDPRREGVVYVSTYSPVSPSAGGLLVYRTLDDGRSWEPLSSLPRAIDALAAAPSDGTLYALGGAGVFVSRDAGSTWSQARRALPARVNTLAVDPSRPDVLWLSADDDHVWRSADGGRTFARLERLGPIGKLVFDPADPAHPYASVELSGFAGIYQRRRDGWKKVGASDADFESTVGGALAFDSVHGILYAGTTMRGLYRLQ